MALMQEAGLRTASTYIAGDRRSREFTRVAEIVREQ